jgi:hypothetical protein
LLQPPPPSPPAALFFTFRNCLQAQYNRSPSHRKLSGIIFFILLRAYLHNWEQSWCHGLINYMDQSKMSSSKKIYLQRNFAADVYQSLHIDGRNSQPCWYFRSSFVNCYPYNLYNLLCGSSPPPPPFKSPPTHPPLPCVKKYTVYTYTDR